MLPLSFSANVVAEGRCNVLWEADQRPRLIRHIRDVTDLPILVDVLSHEVYERDCLRGLCKISSRLHTSAKAFKQKGKHWIATCTVKLVNAVKLDKKRNTSWQNQRETETKNTRQVGRLH